MRLTLILACMLCFWALTDAHRGRKMRKGGFRPKYGDSSEENEDKPSFRERMTCKMAHHACKVEGPSSAQLKTGDCPVNATCSRGPVTITRDGQQYKFTFCSSRPEIKEMCFPDMHGDKRGRGDRKPRGPSQKATPAPAPGRQEAEPEFPPATESEAENLFCEHPGWFMLACSVNTSDGMSVKQLSCSRGGDCTKGPATYTFNGTTVQAYFCDGCQTPPARPRRTFPRPPVPGRAMRPPMTGGKGGRRPTGNRRAGGRRMDRRPMRGPMRGRPAGRPFGRNNNSRRGRRQ